MAGKTNTFHDCKVAVLKELQGHPYLKNIAGKDHEAHAHFWLVFWSDLRDSGLNPYQSKAKDLSEFEATWLTANQTDQPKGKAPRSKGKAKDLIFAPPAKSSPTGSTGQYEQLMAQADKQRNVAEQARKQEIRTLEALIKKATSRLDELTSQK
jgi:hypothetical protein